MAVTPTKINDFVTNWAKGHIDFDTDAFKMALSNTAPASETNNPTADGNGVLANVTQIAYTNLTVPALVVASANQAAGLLKVIFDDKTVSAAGGAGATFRYIYVYDDTPVAPADALVCVIDYGVGGVTLADGESLLVNFDGTAGLLQVT